MSRRVLLERLSELRGSDDDLRAVSRRIWSGTDR
jgi:hypothetical protein